MATARANINYSALDETVTVWMTCRVPNEVANRTAPWFGVVIMGPVVEGAVLSEAFDFPVGPGEGGYPDDGAQPWPQGWYDIGEVIISGSLVKVRMTPGNTWYGGNTAVVGPPIEDQAGFGLSSDPDAGVSYTPPRARRVPLDLLTVAQGTGYPPDPDPPSTKAKSSATVRAPATSQPSVS